MKKKKVVIFDLWETLVFGTEDSAISIFYNEITGKKISYEQMKECLLISDVKPRIFIEKFLNIVAPTNMSSVLLSLKNPRSPRYKKMIGDFEKAIKKDSQEVRWLPGAIDLLESLKEQYELVLVSNLWAYQKKYLLKNLHLGQYFDKCLFSCDLGVTKNVILMNIEEILKVDVSNVVSIGKSYEHDIIPATNAQLSAIRFFNEDNIISPKKMKAIIDEEFNIASDQAPKSSKVKQDQSKIKILSVIPPFFKLLGSHNNRLNLSVSYLSAFLGAKGFNNKVYHCDSESKENYITRYQMVFNSVNFYDELEKNKSYKQFEQYFQDNVYDVVFVSCGDLLNPSFDSGNWDSAKKISKIVRKINPKAYIIAIGPEIGINSEDFDLLVHGEIENQVEKILENRIRGNIKGSLLSEKMLKECPPFDINNMVTPFSPVSLDTIIWRRGCKGQCDFCRVAQINEGGVRYRAMESVIDEIRLRHDLMGVRDFYITDANFTSNKKLGIEFCRKINNNFPNITWRTESRFDTLDRELLIEMKKSGCTHIKLGLENALNEKYQVKTKRVNLELANEWIREVQDNIGIKCVVYLMLGGKWFTKKQYEQMYENAKNLNASGYTVSLFTPYPGTSSGVTHEEWKYRKFTGSHLDIRLVDFWKIPIEIVEAFFSLELKKGREDKRNREFTK